jgi:hypothetical protein
MTMWRRPFGVTAHSNTTAWPLVDWHYYFLVLLVTNVGGEESWWRGYLLPRQELSHGCGSVASSRQPLGFISLVFSMDASKPDPHASHLLCSGVRGATSKEHVAGNNRTHVWQQCADAANISRDFRIEICALAGE